LSQLFDVLHGVAIRRKTTRKYLFMNMLLTLLGLQCIAGKSRKVESQQPPKRPLARYGGFFADLVAVLRFFEPPEWPLSGCSVAVAPLKLHNTEDLPEASFRL
jgi:hypothetical protein